MPSLMVELLAFLLPVAAASGWYAALRKYGREDHHHRTKALHASYSRGLGLLLQDKLDEALEALSPLFQSDVEGLELRLAVGHLFRRKGQVEKALAIHEGLAKQDGLSQEQHSYIAYQLGLDYFAAGLLDRAEAIFSSLRAMDRYKVDALQQLLKIYQRERDWRRAIECTLALRRMHKVLPNQETIAQFYCELAADLASSGDPGEAKRLLQLALGDDPHCVRATIAIGKLFMKQEDWSAALAALTDVERQDPDFLPEVLDMIRLCYERLNRDGELLNYLRHLSVVIGCEDAACLLVERLKQRGDPEAAKRFLQAALTEQTSIKLSRKLLLLETEEGGKAERSMLQLVLRSLPEPFSDTARYCCHRCGFECVELHWNCPSCHGWETIKRKK